MTTTISITGTKELAKALQSMGAEIREAAGDAVKATALEMQGEIKRRIQSGPASGITYQKYNPRRTHRASAPGEAPMTDTGRLAGSVMFDVVGEMSATVGSALVYAAWLEYGTRHMSARPVWTPVAEEADEKFMKRLEAAIGGAVK
jgi:HK97 gp10 family phage protein